MERTGRQRDAGGLRGPEELDAAPGHSFAPAWPRVRAPDATGLQCLVHLGPWRGGKSAQDSWSLRTRPSGGLVVVGGLISLLKFPKGRGGVGVRKTPACSRGGLGTGCPWVPRGRGVRTGGAWDAAQSGDKKARAPAFSSSRSQACHLDASLRLPRWAALVIIEGETKAQGG